MTQQQREFLLELWLGEFLGPLDNPHLCGLCGNRGIIDTTGLRSPAGQECGGRYFCICPNGRARRQGNFWE